MTKRNTDKPKSPSLVTSVNADNYKNLAKPFISAEVFRMVSRLPQLGTRRQWGAWLSYFLRHRIPARAMSDPTIGHHAASGDTMMVPTEWPHMFDANETIQGDHKAGDAYVTLTVPGKRTVWLIPDKDMGFVARKH